MTFFLCSKVFKVPHFRLLSAKQYHIKERKKRFKGEREIDIVNSMKRYVNKILPENVKVPTACTGRRLMNCFKTKDKTNFEHHTILYTT